MTYRFFRYMALFAIVAFLAVPDIAYANLSAATPTPASRTLSLTSPAPVTITWNVRRIGGGTSTFESDDANLRLGSGGPVLTTINKGFSKSVTAPGFVNFTIERFTETLTIPQRYIRQAAEAGLPLVYEREWTDTNFVQSVAGSVVISVGGASSAEFGIDRIELSFDDSSTYKTVETGTPVVAIAHVDATGSGQMRGSWQVRDSDGSGNFRTIRSFSQRIAGQQEVRVISPRLPTFDDGRVDVRLKIDDPDVAFDFPSISYQVMEETAVPDRATVRAQLLAPRPGEPINADTMIRWNAISDAKSYKIDIYNLDDDDRDQPVASMLVKGVREATKPSPVLLENLKDNGKYRVVVRAIR